MEKFMELPAMVAEELKKNEQLLVKGGIQKDDVQPNNAGGTCSGPNNGDGKCGF